MAVQQSLNCFISSTVRQKVKPKIYFSFTSNNQTILACLSKQQAEETDARLLLSDLVFFCLHDSRSIDRMLQDVEGKNGV